MERLKKALAATMGWVDDWICALTAAHLPNAEVYLLGGIYEKLDALAAAQPTGLGLTITPYTLGTDGIRILEKDTLDRVRDVSIWVESATGGPLPVLRIGLSGASSTAGVRVIPGQVNDIGIIPADTELFAASSVAITIYVISHF